MRKLIFLSAALLLFCACDSYKTADIALPDGFTVKAEISDTPQKTEQGLMYRTELPEGKGMVFVFDKDEPRMFWMKNTLIDLDIVFITSDKKVFSAEKNVPHSYTYTPDNQVAYVPGYGQYVLELPAGSIDRHNIMEGSALSFEIK